MSGGTAPTKEPIQVLISERGLESVYGPTYKSRLAAPRAAVSGFEPYARTVTPAAPDEIPHPSASWRETLPEGSGRLRVLFILESLLVSIT